MVDRCRLGGGDLGRRDSRREDSRARERDTRTCGKGKRRLGTDGGREHTGEDECAMTATRQDNGGFCGGEWGAGEGEDVPCR